MTYILMPCKAISPSLLGQPIKAFLFTPLLNNIVYSVQLSLGYYIYKRFFLILIKLTEFYGNLIRYAIDCDIPFILTP